MSAPPSSSTVVIGRWKDGVTAGCWRRGSYTAYMQSDTQDDCLFAAGFARFSEESGADDIGLIEQHRRLNTQEG